MNKPKVDVYQPVDETGESYQRMREAGIEVKLSDITWMQAANRRQSVEVEFDSDTIIGVGSSNRSKYITRRTLEAAPDLRLIAKYSVGFDNVDIDAATEFGILIVHSPTEGNWGGVAEGTMAYMLSVLKKVREKDRHVKNGGWRDPTLIGTYLGARQSDGYPGITIGIIGLGRIGSRLADLLAPWRVRLIAYDPYVQESQFVHHNVSQVDLNTLLCESDVVTIHCNLSKETTGLIGEDELGSMKTTSVLINTARGPIVDIDALFHALDCDRIGGAALDVLPEEPPDPQTPLFGLGDKVILSPHMIANNVGTGLQLAVPWVERAVFATLRGEVPKYVVNEEAIAKWKARFEGSNLLSDTSNKIVN